MKNKMRLFYNIPRKLANLIGNPFAGVVVAVFLIVIFIYTLRLSYEDQSRNIAILSFIFAFFTWLVVEVRKWPFIRVSAVTDRENIFQINSQEGAFSVVVWFRFINRSSIANTVLGSEYWVRVNGTGRWHNFKPNFDVIKGWLNDQLPATGHLYLKVPEVCEPYTAKVRYVAVSGKIPWQRIDNEKPCVYLRACFQMADGSAETVEVELKWDGKLPNIKEQSWIY